MNDPHLKKVLMAIISLLGENAQNNRYVVRLGEILREVFSQLPKRYRRFKELSKKKQGQTYKVKVNFLEEKEKETYLKEGQSHPLYDIEAEKWMITQVKKLFCRQQTAIPIREKCLQEYEAKILACREEVCYLLCNEFL